VKISKTEYAVFVYYKLESKYKKICKFEEVMVQNQKKMSDFKWNASGIIKWTENEILKNRDCPQIENRKICGKCI
jgi:hypothetical protein